MRLFAPAISFSRFFFLNATCHPAPLMPCAVVTMPVFACVPMLPTPEKAQRHPIRYFAYDDFRRVEWWFADRKIVYSSTRTDQHDDGAPYRHTYRSQPIAVSPACIYRQRVLLEGVKS